MWIALGTLLVAICLGATGQICLKAGLMNLGTNPPVGVVLAQIVKNWLVMGGFACYGVSSLLYLVALSRLDLCYAYPLIALTYVIVTLVAWRLLGEMVPLGRVVGLAIICIGVLVVALTYAGSQPTPAAADNNAITQALSGQD